MTAMVLTPTGRALSRSSALASPPDAAAAIRERSEGGKGADSCYYPGCRKDTNCHCEICQASINATLDLIPSCSSIQQKSSLTKLSASAAPRGRAPSPPPSVSSPSCTPVASETGSAPASPPLRSTAKSRPSVKKAAAKNGGSCAIKWRLLCWVAGLCLVLATDYGVPVAVQRMLGSPMLTSEMVKMAGERSQVGGNLKEKLVFLQESFGEILGTQRVSNCSSASNWGFHQEGHLFRATCVMYKSATEELSIWGCPMQASGWLMTRFSSRWITVLSGRITEWSAEKFAFTPRASNGSWTYSKWTTTAIHLDPNTWVLEFQGSSLHQNSRILPPLWEFFKIRISKRIKELRHGAPLLLTVSHNSNTYIEALPPPT